MADAQQQQGGGFFDALGEMAKTLFVETPKAVMTDPFSLFNEKGQVSVQRMLQPGFRQQAVEQQKMEQDLKTAAAKLEIAGKYADFSKLFSNAATPQARAAYARAVRGMGVPDTMVNPLLEGANADAGAFTGAATESGMGPLAAAIATRDSALQAGNTALSGRTTRENQTHGTNEALREDAIKRTRENQGMPEALSALATMDATPEGQTALEDNPALAGSVAVAKRYLAAGGGKNPAIDKSVMNTILQAAQKGAVATGASNTFGGGFKNKLTQDQLDMDQQIAGMKQIADNFDKEYTTAAGRGKAYAQSWVDYVGMLPEGSFLEKRNEFASLAKRQYMTLRKFFTGVAGEEAIKDEVAVVLPDIENQEGPVSFMSKLRGSMKAAEVMNQILANWAARGYKPTQADRVAAGREALTQATAAMQSGGGSNGQSKPITDMTDAEMKAELGVQ